MAMNIETLLEQLKNDELAEKLQDCESIDEFVAKARELGYEIKVEEVEEITNLTDEALEGIAGGVLMDPNIFIKASC